MQAMFWLYKGDSHNRHLLVSDILMENYIHCVTPVFPKRVFRAHGKVTFTFQGHF